MTNHSAIQTELWTIWIIRLDKTGCDSVYKLSISEMPVLVKSHNM